MVMLRREPRVFTRGALVAVAIPCWLGMATTGCSTVVDFDGYQFPEAKKACDGSPAYEDPYEDGSLRLFNTEALGIPAAPQAFTWGCVLDRGRLVMCEETAELELTTEVPTNIAGEGIIPPYVDTNQPAKLVVNAPISKDVVLNIDVSRRDVELRVDAPFAEVLVSTTGRGILYLYVTGLRVFVGADGIVYLMDVEANSLRVGAGTVETRGPIPANSVLDEIPGAILFDECRPLR